MYRVYLVKEYFIEKSAWGRFDDKFESIPNYNGIQMLGWTTAQNPLSTPEALSVLCFLCIYNWCPIVSQLYSQSNTG